MELPSYDFGESSLDYNSLLRSMASRNMDVVEVIASPLIPDEDVSDIVTKLSTVALQQQNIEVVNKLAKAAAIASGIDDNAIPEARVSMKPSKVRSISQYFCYFH